MCKASFQDRVVEEKKALDEKSRNLVRFMSTQEFNDLAMDEQRRMKRQYSIMDLYSQVLEERIENFT